MNVQNIRIEKKVFAAKILIKCNPFPANPFGRTIIAGRVFLKLKQKILCKY